MECFLLENPPITLVTHLTKMQQVTSNPINYPLSLTTSLTFPEEKKKKKSTAVGAVLGNTIRHPFLGTREGRY